MIKSFASLKIKLILEGGYTMDYKIVEKDQFTLIGVSKILTYEEAVTEVPKLWAEFHRSEKAMLFAVCTVCLLMKIWAAMRLNILIAG